jgi:glutamyl-tRNA(Gln) amidotransferase subunit D
VVHIFNTGGTISYGATGATGVRAGAVERLVAGLGLDGPIAYRELLRKGSVNVQPADWQVVAAAVHEAIEAGAVGVIVLHGTDTMTYTAAALSFMLGPLPAPVVLTGSMRPGGAPDSDAVSNLRHAAMVAGSGDFGEVCVVFTGDARRGHSVILRGNRTRKAHADALEAFASPNHPPLGSVDGEEISYGPGARLSRGGRAAVGFSPELNPRVRLIRYHPGCTAGFVAAALGEADGAVIEGTGLGHLPTEGGLLETIRRWGKPVVLVSACWQGGVRLGLYDVDQAILAVPNIIPGHDLTPEAAVVKLMWVLGREQALERVRARIWEPAVGDITPDWNDGVPNWREARP